MSLDERIIDIEPRKEEQTDVSPSKVRKERENVPKSNSEPKGNSLGESVAESNLREQSSSSPIDSIEELDLSKFDRTDAGNGEMFAYYYKGKIKYDHTRERWLVWNGIIWAENNKNDIYMYSKALARERKAQARVKAKKLTDALLAEIDDNTVPNLNNNPEKRELVEEIRHCFRLEQLATIQRMLEMAKGERWISSKFTDWDTNPYLIGVRNGIVDLQTGELIHPSPHIRITMQTNTYYNPKEEREPKLWLQALENMYGHMGNDGLDYIYRYLGYSITGVTKEQCLICLYGEGENGKSHTLEVMVKLLGNYGYTMPFSALEFKDRSQISNDIAALVGKRIVVASESQENVRLNEGRIKSLTGDESITARFLNREFFTFDIMAKFWLAFNHKPLIIDDTHGFWRRMRLVPLSAVFSKDNPKRIDNFKERALKEEGELIFNWLVKQAVKWYKEGLGEIPLAIKEATERYRREENPLANFISEMCIESADYIEPVGDMYSSYVQWSRDSHERYVFSRKVFNKRLEAMGYKMEIRTAKRVYHWLGLRLKTLEEIGEKPENLLSLHKEELVN